MTGLRLLLMMTLAVGQVAGWNGRSLYLCFSPEGHFRGIDGGPTACFYAPRHSKPSEGATLVGDRDDTEHGEHVLLSVDPLVAHARQASAPPAPSWLPFEHQSFLGIEAIDFVWIGTSSSTALLSSLPHVPIPLRC